MEEKMNVGNWEKKELRQWVMTERAKLAPGDISRSSQLIFNRLEKLRVFQEASNILLYWSISNEVSTHRFIRNWNEKKAVFLPAITKEGLVVEK